MCSSVDIDDKMTRNNYIGFKCLDRQNRVDLNFLGQVTLVRLSVS